MVHRCEDRRRIRPRACGACRPWRDLYRNTTELVASADIVTHTYQVIGSLDRLIQSMIDAETGERGYIITGDESFLEP